MSCVMLEVYLYSQVKNQDKLWPDGPWLEQLICRLYNLLSDTMNIFKQLYSEIELLTFCANFTFKVLVTVKGSDSHAFCLFRHLSVSLLDWVFTNAL